MKPLAVLIALVLVQQCCGHHLESSKWNTLKVTWGPKSNNSEPNPYYFWPVPLTAAGAGKKNFSKISESSACEGEKFAGYRYAQGNDTSLVVLYDANGNVAGIQSGFPKKLISPPDQEEWFKKSQLLVDDVINGIPTYTLTAYFNALDTVCKNPRSPADVAKNPIGTHLYIQVKGSSDYWTISMKESNVNGKVWTKGGCVPTMGVHYWRNLTSDMDCNKLAPVFPLFNKGKLTGVGWMVFNVYNFTQRYELPASNSFPLVMKEVPRCIDDMLKKTNGFTTMHIFTNTDLFNDSC